MLIGLLTIGLGASLYSGHQKDEEARIERLADKEEKDSLRTALVNMSIECAAKETALHKEYFEKLTEEHSKNKKK